MKCLAESVVFNLRFLYQQHQDHWEIVRNADSQSHSDPLSQNLCRQAPHSVMEEGPIKRKSPELVEGAQPSCKNSEPRDLPAGSSQLMVTCGVTVCKLDSVGSCEKWAC